MKKTAALCLAVLAFCLLFCSCGKEVVEEKTTAHSSPVNSDWVFAYMKDKNSGERTYASEIEDKNLAPYFMTPDGLNFLFKENGKNHSGTIDVVDGRYFLKYKDGTGVIRAELSENTLKIHSSDDTMIYVFTTEN